MHSCVAWSLKHFHFFIYIILTLHLSQDRLVTSSSTVIEYFKYVSLLQYDGSYAHVNVLPFHCLENISEFTWWILAQSYSSDSAF